MGWVRGCARDGRDEEDVRSVGWGDQGLDVFGLKLEELVGRSLGSQRTTLHSPGVLHSITAHPARRSSNFQYQFLSDDMKSTVQSTWLWVLPVHQVANFLQWRLPKQLHLRK